MFAHYSEQQGADPTMADQKAPVRRGKWKVHYRPDLDESMTIVAKEKRWDITSVQEISPKQGLILHATWTKGQYSD